MCKEKYYFVVGVGGGGGGGWWVGGVEGGGGGGGEGGGGGGRVTFMLINFCQNTEINYSFSLEGAERVSIHVFRRIMLYLLRSVHG